MYPGNFLRLVAGGTLYNVEDWTWSLSIVPNFEGTPANYPAVPQAIIDAVVAFHQGAGITQQDARLTYIKVNMIGPDGRYVSDTESVRHDFTTPVPGASTARAMAPQVALSVSLTTPAKRGLAHGGRFYIPVPAPAVGGDGRISQADAQAVADQARTMILALNTAVTWGDVGVASNVGAGKFQPCTGVRVGRVLDTIRSRREKFLEAYTVSAAIDTGAD